MANPGKSVDPVPIAERDNVPSNVDIDSAKRDEGVEVALEGGVVTLRRAAEVGAMRFSKGGGVVGREVGGKEVTTERGRETGLTFSFGSSG